jgi:hypothetical protein
MATETRAALLALALAAAGCGGTNNCRSKTVLLAISLDAAAAQADALDIDVTIDGNTNTSHLTHAAGSTGGTVEVRFPSGYPAGKSVAISVTALAGGSPVGSGTASFVAASGCDSRSVTVQGGAVAEDLSMTSGDDLSMSMADLTPPADIACASSTENCFNGVDDNCDGKVDCEDPQCTPVAECVPDPGTANAAALGTLSTSACASDYTTTTALFANLAAGTCTSGSCQCQGGFVSTPTCSTSLTQQGSTIVSCSAVGTSIFSNKTNADGCLAFTALNTNTYYTIDAVKYNATCNAPSGGTPMKNAPTWSTSDKFCTGAPVGKGCTAGNICVPKAANHCILTTGSAATCSVAGYTVANATAFFTGFDDSARSCACACNVAGTCGTSVGFGNGSCGALFAVGGGTCQKGLTYDHAQVSGPSGTACTTGATESGATSTTGFERTLCCTN